MLHLLLIGQKSFILNNLMPEFYFCMINVFLWNQQNNNFTHLGAITRAMFVRYPLLIANNIIILINITSEWTTVGRKKWFELDIIKRGMKITRIIVNNNNKCGSFRGWKLNKQLVKWNFYTKLKMLLHLF